MKSLDIKGKDYIPVNERIKYFRHNFTGYSLTSEIIHRDEKTVTIKATIKNPDGFELASGIAMEVQGTSYINKRSHIENCETSAWGRALGNFGIGIDDSIASADEVANAINNQNKPVKPTPKPHITEHQAVDLLALCSGRGLDIATVLAKCKLKEFTDCPVDRYDGLVNFIEKMEVDK